MNISDIKAVRKLGEGSFAEVYLAKSSTTGRLFAVKRLKKKYRNVDEINQLPEVAALKALQGHPNIVRLYAIAFDEKNGYVSMFFELMDCNIYELITEHKIPFDEKTTLILVYQLLSAISFIHSKNMFHRDIKPENCMVNKDTMVLKLCDFGSTRCVNGKGPFTEYVSTRWYRAPECILTSGSYGPKVDEWAVGCMIYELLTTKPLFPGKHELDQIGRIHNLLGTPPPKLLESFRSNPNTQISFSFPHRVKKDLSRIIPNISLETVELIDKLLTYDPNRRIAAKDALNLPAFNKIRYLEAMWKKTNKKQPFPLFYLKNVDKYEAQAIGSAHPGFSLIKSKSETILRTQKVENDDEKEIDEKDNNKRSQKIPEKEKETKESINNNDNDEKEKDDQIATETENENEEAKEELETEDNEEEIDTESISENIEEDETENQDNDEKEHSDKENQDNEEKEHIDKENKIDHNENEIQEKIEKELEIAKEIQQEENEKLERLKEYDELEKQIEEEEKELMERYEEKEEIEKEIEQENDEIQEKIEEQKEIEKEIQDEEMSNHLNNEFGGLNENKKENKDNYHTPTKNESKFLTHEQQQILQKFENQNNLEIHKKEKVNSIQPKPQAIRHPQKIEEVPQKQLQETLHSQLLIQSSPKPPNHIAGQQYQSHHINQPPKQKIFQPVQQSQVLSNILHKYQNYNAPFKMYQSPGVVVTNHQSSLSKDSNMHSTFQNQPRQMSIWSSTMGNQANALISKTQNPDPTLMESRMKAAKRIAEYKRRQQIIPTNKPRPYHGSAFLSSKFSNNNSPTKNQFIPSRLPKITA